MKKILVFFVLAVSLFTLISCSAPTVAEEEATFVWCEQDFMFYKADGSLAMADEYDEDYNSLYISTTEDEDYRTFRGIGPGSSVTELFNKYTFPKGTVYYNEYSFYDNEIFHYDGIADLESSVRELIASGGYVVILCIFDSKFSPKNLNYDSYGYLNLPNEYWAFGIFIYGRQVDEIILMWDGVEFSDQAMSNMRGKSHTFW